jgi:hypothetical protein
VIDMTQMRKPNPLPSTPASPTPEDQKKRDEMQRRTRFTIPYLIGAFVLIWLFQDFVLAPLVIRSTQIPYSGQTGTEKCTVHHRNDPWQ